MRVAALFLCLIAAALPVSPAASAPAARNAVATPADAAFAEFDRSIAATKQAMMGDPAHALASAQQAGALAYRLPPGPRAQVAIATAQWLHGEALLYLNDIAGAAPIIDGALKTAERFARDTKLHGDLLRSHGAIAATNGQVLQALRDYQRAHDVFQAAKVPRSQAITLQDIGQIYFDAADYDRALDYYRQSEEAYNDDPSLALTRHNDRAQVLRKQHRYPEAAQAYRAALREARKLDSPLLETRLLTNLASSEADAGRLGRAQDAANQALALASHGEGAGWQPFVYGVAAKLAAQRGDNAHAAELIERTFRGVDLTKSEMNFREDHQTAAKIYEALGDEQRALAHLKAFQRLDREAQNLTASAASQLVAARFDFTNQNLKISKLKADQLQRDIQIERQKTTFQRMLLTGLLGAGALVFGLLLFGYFSIRKSRDRVHAANASLTDANVALEKAIKAKTEFLATTSHEIRTPLNGILGMTQVLLADGNVADDVRERIEVVHGAGETMRALVDDILDVAKMESGKLTVQHEPTDLARILADAARLWGGQAQAKGLELRLDIEDAPTRIVSDGARLRQIVFNLMSNALKFTEAGAVTLSAAAESNEGEGETLALRVADTGIGIPSDRQGEIFEAFKQIDGGVTRQYGGTGLGLAICRQLALALGGEIGLESAPGEGTVFTVRLPLERAGSDLVVATDDGASEGALAEAALLIVDRNPANRSVMHLLLAAEAASVAVADTAEEADAALATGGVSHVIVDAGAVPGSVADVQASLRALTDAARARDAKVTILLAPGGPASIADLMALGASQLIVKPIGAAALLEALRSLYGDDPESFVAPALLDRQAA